MSQLNKKHKNKILKAINENDTISIIADTGSGKSTTIMSWLVEAGYKVLNSQITIAATVNLGEFQGKNLGNKNVGTAFEGKVNYFNCMLNHLRNNNYYFSQQDTKLIYCTTGHLEKIYLDIYKHSTLNKEEKDLKFVDIIVIDEAHLKTLEQEVIFRIHYLLKKKGFLVPKIILCSATLDLENFKDYSDNIEQIQISVRKYPIKIKYHKYNFNPNDQSLYLEAAQIVLSENNKRNIPEEGDVWLIFCPGFFEMELICKHLNKFSNSEEKDSEEDDGLRIFKAHGGMNTEDNKKIFEPQEPGTRKIIVATNIAETSVTIENLSFIVDTMCEKVAETSSTGGLKLELKHISKSSAKQRSGRTGRTCQGIVYRMCTEDFFNNALENQRKPELFRVPLHTMLIKLFNASLNPKKIFGDIKIKKFKESLDLLKKLNLVIVLNENLEKNDEELEKIKDFVSEKPIVTEAGFFVSKMPLSVRSGTLLYKFIQKYTNGSDIFAAISFICMTEILNGKSLFYYKDREKNQNFFQYRMQCESTYRTYFRRYASSTIIGTFLNVWNDYLDENKDDLSSQKIKKYCLKNNINNKKFSEFISILKQTINALSNKSNDFIENEIKFSNFSNLEILKKLLPIYKFVYSDLFFIKEDDKYIKISGKKEEYIMYSSVQMITENLIFNDEIIAINSIEIDKGSEIKKMISLSIPFREKDIKD